MTKEELERANFAYQRLLMFEKKNRELSSIDTNVRETLLVFGTPSKNIEVRIGKKTLKHFLEYLLAYGKQEVEKCKKELEEL
jgi:hypothetical protein